MTIDLSTIDLSRYARQIRYPGMGEEGQRKLLQKRALVCGCGALGSVIANTLARAGVGHLRIVDRDYLELNNLQRQVLYDEEDVRSGLPKAIAASEKLSRINSQIEIEPHVADVDARNMTELCKDVDVIVDGTDNFETRFLLNDASVKFDIPWVFGGCIGADGQTMSIIPRKTACLRCLMLDGPPPPGTTPTCDSAGILGSIINVIASMQALEAIKMLTENLDHVSRNLTVFQLWDNEIRNLNVETLRDSVDCPVCKHDKFEWLDGERGSQSAILCGRNAVQLSSPDREPLDLGRLETKLEGDGTVERNKFLLRFRIDEFLLTIFPDGRAIVTGTEDIAVAKSLYARWIGN